MALPGRLETLLHITLTSMYNLARLAKSIVYDWSPFKFFLALYLVLSYHSYIETQFANFASQSSWAKAFSLLFAFKFLKVTVHTFSFLLYRPYPIPKDPIFKPGDVTVIIPTVGAIDDQEFRETLKTIIANKPAHVIVCTVGRDKLEIADRVCAEKLATAKARCPTHTLVRAISIDQASKRRQIFQAIQAVKTPIVALADDHVFWGEKYLESALAPFEDPTIGGVGTNKRVLRVPFAFTWANFLNFIACLYLERHNFECTASVFIDQGVFVLSGRSVLYRTAILKHPRFEQEYCHETWFFGLVGRNGFAVDDDNLLTRFTTGIAGYKVWFQNTPDSTMFTTLGKPSIFFKQMDRWIRTTWRSNSTSLFSDQTPWKTQPWSVYAIYLSSFVNFALFYDAALYITLWYSLVAFETAAETSPQLSHCVCPQMARNHYDDLLREAQTKSPAFNISVCQSSYPSPQFAMYVVRKPAAMMTLAFVSFISKMIKPFPHFWRNPKDTLYIPFYILFGYYHSLIKLKALFTVSVIAWGTRPGVK
ncbi:capsule polysaccharide synthase [Diplocarpon rosae]|nr:capsule polysaccharide synthase [Diplocarpon rosae]